MLEMISKRNVVDIQKQTKQQQQKTQPSPQTFRVKMENTCSKILQTYFSC